MQIREIIECLEAAAPPVYQESYDNSGLQAGDPEAEVTGALVTLDCTEEVIREAVERGCNMVIAHHPVIFSGLKRLTGGNYVERTILAAIKADVAIYACHTNLDNIGNGVNRKIADKLGLSNCRVLAPKGELLQKLVTFVPESHHKAVAQALFSAGAGKIGNYDSCSFSSDGTGTFRGNQDSNPFAGKKGELSNEAEKRLEVLFPSHLQKVVLRELRGAHPYEEPAFDIYDLANKHPGVGSGLAGELEKGLDESAFLQHVKTTFRVPFIKHTKLLNKTVKKVAVCGGSGRFLLKNALAAGVDAFITSDFKYHEYFDAEGRLLVVDTGHYESEQYTPEIFYEIIREKFSKFAVHLSKTNTNPVNYF